MLLPRYVWLMLACGLFAQFACAPTGRLGVSQLLLHWSGPNEDIELFSDGTAITTLRYRESFDGKSLLAKTYRTHGKPARNESARTALRLLSPIAPAPPKPDAAYFVARVYEYDQAAITITFREYDLERYPIWQGMHEEVRRCASCDLLIGLFYRYVAESCVTDDTSEAAADYLHALRSLQEWGFRVNRESEYPGSVDSDLEVRPVALFVQTRRYQEAIERARRAWSILTQGVTVRAENGVEVVSVKDLDAERKDLIDRAERETP